MFVIPLDRIDVDEGIKIRSNAKEVARLAATCSAKIPDASKSMNLLAKAYLRSPLARFHNWFYAEEHDADALWPETYDLTPMDVLPPNVCYILKHPNDLSATRVRKTGSACDAVTGMASKAYCRVDSLQIRFCDSSGS
jgi:hypothetical protein